MSPLPAPAGLPILGGAGVALLCLALVCWLLFLSITFSVAGKEVHGDAAMGQGIAWLYAIILAALAWLWIGGLLLKAGTDGMMPAGGLALIPYLFCGAAGAASLLLLTDDVKHVWPLAIPALLPPILAFYVLALYLPSLRPVFAGQTASLVVWGVIMVLGAAPWAPLFARMKQKRVNRAAAKMRWKELQRAESLGKLQAMPPDAPVWEWFALLREESGVRPEALEAVRHLARRQADVEELVETDRALYLLPDLDLQATPRLCAAAVNYLLKYAKETRIRSKQVPREYTPGWVEESLPAVRWLMANGCDCDEAVAAMQASVETWLDTPDRQTALAALAALRKK
jgi:hypothetical protein